MAQFNETHDAYDTVGRREQLADMIYDISPEKTPFMTNAGRGVATAIYSEWQLDALDDVDNTNAHIDGNEFAGEAVTPTSRVGNYCQISKKEFTISRRSNKVKKAGRTSELARETAKKSKSLKRDCEAILLNNQASLAGTSSVAPTLGGVPAWLETNTDRGLTGTDGGFNSGTGVVDAAGDGTVRALSEAGLLGVIESIYANSDEDIDVLMLSPAVVQLFSGYMFANATPRIATPYQEHGKGSQGAKVLGAVQQWVTDLGTVDVVPNRWQRGRDALILSMGMWEVQYLDSFKTEEIAKIGDHERRHIIVDYTLCSKNEAASGIFADVDVTAAMVA